MTTSLPTRFDTDTAVERTGSGQYSGRIDPGWWIIAGPNGGYVAAILLRALMLEVNDPARTPRSLTIHYLRPPTVGAVDIAIAIERAGRTLTTATARLTQGGRLIAIAIGAFALPREAFTFRDREAPRLRPVEASPRFRDKYPGSVEMQQRYEAHWALGGELGSGADRAVLGGWIRFEEPRVVDALAVAAYTDALPPAVFTRATTRERLGPVPTIDLTIHFRTTLPVPGATATDFCAVVFTSTVAREGFIEEDGEVWSADGILLAQSRQLALVG